MSVSHNFDLNLSPGPEDYEEISTEEEGSNNVRFLDLNIPLEDVSEVEILHQSQEEITRNTGQEVESQSERVTKKMLPNEERRAIYLALLRGSINGKLRKGTIPDIARLFSVSNRTVSRIWKQSKNRMDNDVVDVSHHKTKNCGRKRVVIDRDQFKSIPLSKRTTLRSLACATKVSKSALHRKVKSDEDIRRHTNPVKPFLKESNKKARVQFCLSMIDKNSVPHDPKFVDMYNVIHIDEKWFYISKKTEKYYLLKEECDPERTCKSKNFLTKVMFLAAIARPRFDADGKETFSGKIGIFPFVTQQPAKRSSSNRVAGTFETKPMTSVGKDTIRSYLINKVIPDILQKWPFDDNVTIVIQQDNARTHIDSNDEEFRLAISRLGLNIQVICQPPNSPDLNVLDLGFFNAIQSLQQKERATTVNDLIAAVERAFETYPASDSNHIFLSLQMCMMEIMKVRGSNNYNIPHINKAALERKGILPIQMQCDAKLLEDVTEWLNSCEDT